MISDERLMAYVDGEIDAEERAAIEAALADDEALRVRLAGERGLRHGLGALYDPVLDEPLPGRLTALLEQPAGRVLELGRPQRPRWRWAAPAAIAASLVVGVLVGQVWAPIAPKSAEGSMLQAQGALAVALETQLASTQDPSAALRIGISFRGPDGAPCRTFETAEAAGLACRADGGWRLRLVTAGSGAQRTQYQQAGSPDALVMTAAQALIVGEPMDARQEREARDGGWRSVR
jgi:hypothetical protein